MLAFKLGSMVGAGFVVGILFVGTGFFLNLASEARGQIKAISLGKCFIIGVVIGAVTLLIAGGQTAGTINAVLGGVPLIAAFVWWILSRFANRA